jgi:pyridoxal phosphate enzyme (YggS family)
MTFNEFSYEELVSELDRSGVTLVAVSKTMPVDDIRTAYAAGHRDFGENYVQELISKQGSLPLDIRWHFIGHLQRNKVKSIAPFVHLIHGVDSVRLALEIDKQGRSSGRVIEGLLQVHIASEDTKHGFLIEEVRAAMKELEAKGITHFRIIGLMGMATFTEDHDQVRSEFRSLASLFRMLIDEKVPGYENLKVLSMGMSGDYKAAIEEGSNMVRIGSLIFGARNYDK